MTTDQEIIALRFGSKPAKPSSYLHALRIIAWLLAVSVAAQTVSDPRGTVAAVPFHNQPPAEIVIDPPSAEALSLGRVVIRYRAQHLQFIPVFGPAALAISPRVGHVHVSVDDTHWVWADASGEPVMIFGLAPGPHQVRIRLVSANHQQLDEGTVKFTVPEAQIGAAGAVRSPEGTPPVHNQPPARIAVHPPLPEPLSRGVIFLRYRTENLDILPVFGPGAAAVSPRIGHIHVAVDNLQWRWIDASGNPIILQGLAPGSHKILIQLSNANHEVIDRQIVEIAVPAVDAPRSAHH